MNSNSKKSVYGTYSNAMRKYIREQGCGGIIATKAELIKVYIEQEKRNIQEIPGYVGQNAKFYSLNVGRFLKREGASRLLYVKTKNNRMTGLWMFKAEEKEMWPGM
jgi:hypothetical protein